MIIINTLFCTHPKNYRDDARKVMMAAAQLKDDAREVFLVTLKEDPDLIISYDTFIEAAVAKLTVGMQK
ncbi:hypothetical protein DSO57_1028708 [Entomophthora muscae]|uniref:Uncharacterized protein n=1 Tax=Entomophthora muscae TaxID=34485 RepID=A0ACC2TD04_9FUNG|nr:hypothetical protein DSO57_1028708 [Entomophthora muscae]